MYTLRGANNQEHGPLSARDVREWILTGRAHRDTPARAAGEATWRPLSQFVEFEAALQSSTAAPAPPPFDPPRTYRLLAFIGLTLSLVGTCFLVTAYNLSRGTPGPVSAICALLCFITAVPALLLGITSRVLSKKRPHEFGGARIANAAIIISLIWLIGGPSTLYLGFIKLRRGGYQGQDCFTHARSLTMSLRVMSIANKGAFPDADSWCDAIRKEVTSTNHYQCPEDPTHSACAYAYNAALSGVKDPNPNTVMIFESDLGWNGSGGFSNVIAKPRHGNRVIVGFASGQVRPVRTNEFSQLRWNP